MNTLNLIMIKSIMWNWRQLQLKFSTFSGESREHIMPWYYNVPPICQLVIESNANCSTTKAHFMAHGEEGEGSACIKLCFGNGSTGDCFNNTCHIINEVIAI